MSRLSGIGAQEQLDGGHISITGGVLEFEGSSDEASERHGEDAEENLRIGSGARIERCKIL